MGEKECKGWGAGTIDQSRGKSQTLQFPSYAENQRSFVLS